MDQQFEELNNKLNSVTDPTGFLRMVSRNNLFNRYVILSNHLIVPMLLLRYICDQQALLRPTFTQKEMKNKGLGKGDSQLLWLICERVFSPLFSQRRGSM